MFAILASCSASVSRQEADGNPQELIYLKHSVCKYLTTLTFKLNARIIKVTCYLNSAGVRCTDTALNSTRRLRTNTSCRQKHRGHKTPLRHQAARQRIGTISAGSVAAILLSKGDPCVPSFSAKLLPHTASIHENMQCSAPNDCDHYTVQKEHHRTPPTKRRSGRDFQCRISHTNTDKPDQPREPRPQILPRPRHPFIHDQPSIPCGRLL